MPPGLGGMRPITGPRISNRQGRPATPSTHPHPTRPDRSLLCAGPAPHPAALVDPCEPSAVLAALQSISEQDYSGEEIEPVAILTTHHHWDHAAGNKALLKHFPRMKVYGGRDDVVSGCTHSLSDGDYLLVGSIEVQALSVPCHTRGSLLYLIDGPTPAFFGGDTLFCGGCGAPFEGTAEEMSMNFVKIWRSCPPNTLVFPGHEYTLTILPGYLNGSSPWPDSPVLYSKICSSIWRAQQLRSLHPPVPTVPVLLADEFLINTNFAPLRTAAEHLVCAWRQFEEAAHPPTVFQRAMDDFAAAPLRPPPPRAPAAVSAPPSPPPSPPQPADPARAAPPHQEADRLFQEADRLFLAAALSGIQMAEGSAAAPGAAASGHAAGGGLGGMHTPPSVGSNFWTTATMAVLPAQHFVALEGQLNANDTEGAKATLRRMRASGQLAPTSVADGAPVHARVHHAPLPHVLGMEAFERPMIVTTTETISAFQLLCAPNTKYLHRDALRRAMTSELLLRRPITAAEADEMARAVGADERGFVTAERFNSQLSVIQPLKEAEPPKQPGRLRRAAGWVRRLLPGSKPPQRYEEADLSDDGHGPQATGYPRMHVV